MKRRIQNNYITFVLPLLIGMITVSSSKADVLRAATADWSPYAMQTEAGELEGIAVEIVREIANLSGHQVEISIMPAKRLNLQFNKNKLDMNFADSPAWNPVSDSPEFLFTKSYTSVVENIYFLEENYFEVLSPKQLAAQTVGITSGYYYELFEDAFLKGDIKKYEARSNRQLILMLEKNRIHAAFFDNVLFSYLLKQEGFDGTRFRKGMQLSDAPIAFKLRKEKAHLLPSLNNAISSLEKSGKIDEIIAKYTL